MRGKGTAKGLLEEVDGVRFAEDKGVPGFVGDDFVGDGKRELDSARRLVIDEIFVTDCGRDGKSARGIGGASPLSWIGNRQIKIRSHYQYPQ